MIRKFRVILEPNELGGYTVTVAALPGCVTQGSSCQQALERVEEAILCHLEGLAAHGVPDTGGHDRRGCPRGLAVS